MEKDLFLNSISEWSFAKDTLFAQFINPTEEEGISLAEIPHRMWQDLTIVYKAANTVTVDGSVSVVGQILISNKELEAWGKTEEELFAQTFANMNAWNRVCIMEFSDTDTLLITELDEGESIPLGEMAMFGICDSLALCGATGICYPEVLGTMEKIIKGDFYIFPSSKHEVAVLPVSTFDYDMSENVMAMQNAMLWGVLSKNVYLYKRENKTIETVKCNG